MMYIRVRAAAIILNDAREILAVLHRDPRSGETWWTLPGGGLEPGESAVQAVVREVREECGIECSPERLIYVREFIDWTAGTHHVGLFFTANVQNYEIITGTDPELDEQYIIEVRFVSKEYLEKTPVPVYPEVFRSEFWQDLESGFSGHRVYLGMQGGGSKSQEAANIGNSD